VFDKIRDPIVAQICYRAKEWIGCLIRSVVVHCHSLLVHVCLVVTLSCKNHCNRFTTFTHVVEMTLEFLIKCFFFSFSPANCCFIMGHKRGVLIKIIFLLFGRGTFRMFLRDLVKQINGCFFFFTLFSTIVSNINGICVI
jgi:hypothetical protein